jgi:hypothetical protein
MGSRANVLRISISRVPWMRSLAFSGIKSSILLVTRRSIRFSYRLSRGTM